MSFRAEWASLAGDLGHLVTSRASRRLDADGLAVALVARRDTLRLLREVLRTAAFPDGGPAYPDRTGTGQIPPTASVTELENRPVGVLMRMLNTVPLPTTSTDLTDLRAPGNRQGNLSGDGPVVGPGDGVLRWAAVRRHAVLADHEWGQRGPTTPEGDARWSAVADVAALSRVVAALDHDLLTAARAHPGPDPDVVEALTRCTVSGLRVAAAEAENLAAAGALPPWDRPGPERDATRVLVVRTPTLVVAGQSRLTLMIRTADALSPGAIAQLARGQHAFLVSAAGALATIDPTRAEQARDMIRSLHRVVAAERLPLTTVVPDDMRPVAQTRALLLAISVAGSKGWNHPSAHPYLPALAAGTDAARDVIHALTARTRSALYSGQWLIPNDIATTPGEYAWRRPKPGEWKAKSTGQPVNEATAPRLLRALEAAAALVDALPPRRPIPDVDGPRQPPPRESLAGLVSAAFRDRPDSPGTTTSGRPTTATLTHSVLRTAGAVTPPGDGHEPPSPQVTPALRWASVAAAVDARLPEQDDWPATAGALQLAHDGGHDVPALLRAAVANRPLGDAPARELRYRLAPHLDGPTAPPPAGMTAGTETPPRASQGVDQGTAAAGGGSPGARAASRQPPPTLATPAPGPAR